MGVMHAWAIGAGALAVGLPLVIHYLTRPRPRRLNFSALRFVRELIEQRRARHRLRDFLILALRVLAVALIAAAFARPFFGARSGMLDPDSARRVRVVILDVSQSMAAVQNGIAVMDRARPLVSNYLHSSPDLRANLILAAAQPRPTLDRPSTNLAALTATLGQAAPRPERLNLPAALALAGDMLADVPPDARRDLVIVSDFQRTNWTAADFSPLPRDTVIELVSAAEGGPVDNLAVTAVRIAGRAEQGRPTRVEVDVGNFTRTARPVQVELTLGGATQRLERSCLPRTVTTLATDMVLPASGWQSGEARLLGVEDALSADNLRPFVVQVRPAPVYLLVTREPASPRPVSSHFLERALAPAGSAAGRERVVRLDAGQLDREALAPADVVVLDHPGKLPDAAVSLLAAALRRGRSMLYVAAEGVDAANLRLLAERVGSDARLPVDFLPASPAQVRKNLLMAEVRAEDPLFAVFGDKLSGVLRTLRFGGGVLTRHREGGLADDILATYSDRSACLVVSPCGSGTLAILNADLTRSNLVGSEAFVPFVGELSDRLLAGRGRQETIHCGDTLVASLPPEAGSPGELKFAGAPTAVSDCGTLAEESGTVVWRWPAAGPPAVYRIVRGAQTVQAVATGLPPEEADLTTVEPRILKERLAGGRELHYRGAAESPGTSDKFWVYLAVAAACCLIAEVFVLRVFKS